MRVAITLVVQDERGNAVDGSAHVYLRNTTTHTTVYSAAVGGSTLPQPLTVTDGQIVGFVDEGQYDVFVTAGSLSWTKPWEAIASPAVVRSSDTRVGLFNAGTNARIPFAALPTITGPAAIADTSSGGTDVVGFSLDPVISGDFTGITGSDPGFAWGMNLFAVADTNAAGLTNITGLLGELAVKKSSGTIAVARGMHADLSLYGASAGATITQAEAMRVSNPRKKNGATGGSITNNYGLFIEAVSGGTSSNFSLFVDVGGVSRFMGRVDVSGTIANAGGSSTDLSLFAGFANADGGVLKLRAAANGGHGDLVLATTNAEFRINDGTTNKVRINRSGSPGFFGAAPPAQPTLNAAATDAATTQALVNQIRSAMIGYGLAV